MSLKYEYGLPNSLEGKSFAEASKRIEQKFKDRNSVVDIRTKQELMSRLRDMQESKREQIQTVNSQNQQMYGGPEGELPWDADTYLAKFMPSKTGENTKIPYQSSTYALNTIQNKPGIISNPNTMIEDLKKSAELPEQQNWWKRNISGKNSWLNKDEGQNKNNILSGVGLAAGILGPMLANRSAMRSMRKPEMLKANLMDEQQITPEYVNRQQLLRNASEQSATQRYLMSQAGGDWAQRSAMLANLAANKLNITGNLMLQSDLADKEERRRVQGLKTNIQQFNIQQQDKTNEINQQNLANYYNQIAAYKQATGANIGAVGLSLFNLIQAKKYGKEMQKAGILKGV